MVFRRPVASRRRRLPPEFTPALERDERVLAWSRVSDRAVVVATDKGLFLPGRRRLGWHEIHKASWTGERLAITPADLVDARDGYAVMVDAPAVAVALPDPGELPHVVRTRVTRSVSFSSHQRVPGGAVRVVARRVPGVDGLTWTVRYDDGTDPTAPGVRGATSRLLASLAASATAGAPVPD